MIGKRGKLLLLVYMIFLGVLFLMCSTDLIIREPEKEIYQVAVIIEDIRDDNYSNFRKGMEQAAVEFNADVRFITLYEKLDADEQLELICREQQDGADALIVVPVDEGRVIRMLEENETTIPVVLLGTEAEAAAGSIVIDYNKMGEQLAEQMLKQISGDCQALVISDPKYQSVESGRFLNGAVTILGNGGCDCQTVTWDPEQGLKDAMEKLRISEGKQAVILAENPELLAETAEVLTELSFLSDHVQGLYGRGNTLAILNHLDQGLITGICVTDEFSVGYFSVCMAIQVLEGQAGQTRVQMDSYYIERQDLRKREYEKMLYPIE